MKFDFPFPNEDIWTLCRLIRVQSGYSIREWAERCAVSKTCVQKWERGDMCPNDVHREMMAVASNIPGPHAEEKFEYRKLLRFALSEAAARYSLTYARYPHRKARA